MFWKYFAVFALFLIVAAAVYVEQSDRSLEAKALANKMLKLDKDVQVCVAKKLGVSTNVVMVGDFYKASSECRKVVEVGRYQSYLSSFDS